LENQSLTERLADSQTENTKLHAQVEKLQKYENSMQNVDLIQVNKKLYQLVSRIGQGGFSEVYHCISFLKDSAKKSYALKKVNLNNLDAQNKDLVMNEIELLKKLQSSNKVIDLID
jgi:serine/threonine protein kinase